MEIAASEHERATKAKIVTTKEAAQRLDMNLAELQAWMRSSDPPPFGYYIKKDGCKRGDFIIHEKQLQGYINGEIGRTPKIDYAKLAEKVAENLQGGIIGAILNKGAS
jgi:hypothetical protein